MRAAVDCNCDRHLGGSYGGYATLVGLTFTPTKFAGGIDIVGPSSLVTLIESFPAYWQPLMEVTWYKRVGDPRTPQGRKMLLERSPITKVDQIQRPLLIGQGANDPRVTQKESDQIVAAMKARNPGDLCDLRRRRPRLRPAGESHLVLRHLRQLPGKCLGGRTEPFGTDLKGAALSVPEGAADVPGLKEALGK